MQRVALLLNLERHTVRDFRKFNRNVGQKIVIAQRRQNTGQERRLFSEQLAGSECLANANLVWNFWHAHLLRKVAQLQLAPWVALAN